ncbi:polymorphic toxin-type HINT domain-containing protein [Streptomyces sp. PR69]|uniref:polymorphic toxin-type HINT domain-containing protein n=1 Tax=Streptomyces sp. PR69 TaxID=2984950 RepID=UPI002263F7D0|nr:polymorphic toxin-type HINT domain-containing protein [Streptomyces sp. PR69]
MTDAKQLNDCVLEIGFQGCTVTFKVTFSATVDFYLCTNPDVPATTSGCPSSDTLLLGTETFKGLTKEVTQYFSKWDLVEQTVVYKVLKAVLVQDFVDCWHGSASGCAWAASNFVPGKAFGKVAEAIRALDAAMHTGVGVLDSFKALKALDIDPATLAKLEGTVNAYEDVVTACKVNSFPGSTRVLMADGSHKAIRDVRTGDLLLAADLETGRSGAQPVTDTFRHLTRRLADITLADGSLTSTVGHRFFVAGRGWTQVADLRVGDRLRTPDGTLHAVTGLRDRGGLSPREVFDLTVDELHTFYVSTEGARPQDVLVHNCTNIVADEGISGAHTLADHVHKTDAQMAQTSLPTPPTWRAADRDRRGRGRSRSAARIPRRHLRGGHRADLGDLEVGHPGRTLAGGRRASPPRGRTGRMVAHAPGSGGRGVRPVEGPAARAGRPPSGGVAPSRRDDPYGMARRHARMLRSGRVRLRRAYLAAEA